MEQAIFYFLAFIIIVSALAVVSLKNIFHCALFLILCLFSIAGIFVMLHAEFLAVVQVLLYVGAIAILMIFAVMLTSRLADREIRMSNDQVVIGVFMSFILALGLIVSLSKTMFKLSDAEPLPESTLAIGKLLMTDFVLPFELVSIVLLAALIGAIVIARQEGN